jgi:integrase
VRSILLHRQAVKVAVYSGLFYRFFYRVSTVGASTTLAMLAAWRAWQQAACFAAEPSEWMFPADDGSPTHPHAFSQAFERIVNRASLPPTRLHDLRHTHASLLIKHGMPLKVVSERLGHAKASFTMDTYQHITPGMQADAARTYERIMAPARAKQEAPISTGRRR